MSSPSAGSVSPMAQDAPLPDAPRPPAGAPSESGSSSELDTSFFPAPAHFYKRYTSANLLLPSSHPDVLSLPNDPITFLARDLEPPNPDWVLERGSYSVFGETWPVEEVLPSLSDMGVTEMFTPRADRTASLQALLSALLLSYTSLISSLLAPPPALSSLPPPGPSGEQPPTDPERLVEHIRLISINMHHLVNELRPVQARETLKSMMRAQIDLRRAKTAAMKAKCAELTATLSSLKLDLNAASASSAPPPHHSGVKVVGG